MPDSVDSEKRSEWAWLGDSGHHFGTRESKSRLVIDYLLPSSVTALTRLCPSVKVK